jgi:hypothetical protein
VDLEGVFRTVGKQLSAGRVSAEYHPYAELKHTWRRRQNTVSFRISDYMDRAPGEVTEALAWYLLCRAFDKRCPDGMAETYLGYARSRDAWAPKKGLYMTRARNLSFRPLGSARDLGSVFDYVNSCYFEGSVRRPDLAWARESPSVRLGFYFEPLDILAANKVLDSEKVPRYVLEFVVYHELLHGVLEAKGSPTRRVHHTKEFRDREKEFSMYDEAEAWLTKLVRKRRAEKGVPQV